MSFFSVWIVANFCDHDILFLVLFQNLIQIMAILSFFVELWWFLSIFNESFHMNQFDITAVLLLHLMAIFDLFLFHIQIHVQLPLLGLLHVPFFGPSFSHVCFLSRLGPWREGVRAGVIPHRTVESFVRSPSCTARIFWSAGYQATRVVNINSSTQSRVGCLLGTTTWFLWRVSIVPDVWQLSASKKRLGATARIQTDGSGCCAARCREIDLSR